MVQFLAHPVVTAIPPFKVIQGHHLVPVESPYATSYVSNLYPLSRSFRYIVEYWCNFRYLQRVSLKIRESEIWSQEYNAYFVTLNGLGVTRECDKQRDGRRTDIANVTRYHWRRNLFN